MGNNVDPLIERRTSRRFQIALPLLLRWADGVDHCEAGHSVNISQGGMLVIAGHTPPLGIDVAVDLVVPAFAWVPRPVRLHGVGRISRSETYYRLKAFAVVIRVASG